MINLKTIKKLTDILGLDTVYQTRNRINVIHDILEDHIRRGDNNQLLINQTGVEMLKRLQDMYESGLLLSEAAEIVRSEYPMEKDNKVGSVSSSSDTIQAKVGEEEFKKHLIEEIHFLRSRLNEKVADKSKKKDLLTKKSDMETEEEPWWYEWI